MSQVGTLYIISAPSGAGKGSLINALLAEKRDWTLQFSVSHTTRAPRDGEIDGEHYHFTNIDDFKQMIDNNTFIEWAKVFTNYYGTSLLNIDEALQNGIDIFLDIDWQGARQVRKMKPDAVSIFILPPSLAELEKRLTNRGQDNADVITKRMQQAQAEMSHYDEYDYLIINNDFEKACYELSSIVSAKRNLTKNKIEQHKKTIERLLN